MGGIHTGRSLLVLPLAYLGAASQASPPACLGPAKLSDNLILQRPNPALSWGLPDLQGLSLGH